MYQYFLSAKEAMKRHPKVWHATEDENYSLCGVEVPYRPGNGGMVAYVFGFIPATGHLCSRCSKVLGKELTP